MSVRSWCPFCSPTGSLCDLRGPPLVFTVCLFCGIASENAHDSEEACIQALHAEIEKTRQILAAVDAPRDDSPIPPGEDQDAHQP